MAVDLAAIFVDIRDRLIDIVQLGVTSMHALAFDVDPNNNLPAWQVTFPSVTPDINGNITVEAQVILRVAKLTESYEGDVQTKLYYDYLPNAVLALMQYRGLRYPSELTGVDYMLNDAEIGRATVAIDNYDNWAIIIPVTIPLQIQVTTVC